MSYLRIARSRLFTRYAVLIAFMVSGLIVALAASEIAQAWRDNESRAASLHAERARSAATRIKDHLAAIEGQVRGVANLPWTAPGMGSPEREFEYRRLQAVVPALAELRFIDSMRRERVRVSQTGLNIPSQESDSELPVASDGKTKYGNAVFRGGIDPYAWAVFPEAAGGGATAALVNMKFVSDFAEAMRFGRTGRAFVVDGAGYVIAHPDIRLVLRRINVSKFPAMAAAIDGRDPGTEGRSFDGSAAEFAAAPIGDTGWWTLVEQSREEVLEPVRTAAYRAMAIALIGLACALAFALMLARHLSGPIVELRSVASRIRAGDLDARAHVGTSDEIEELADELNRMAGELKASYTGLEAKVSERTRELAQANAAKTRFLAAASHDLRQPMHAIGLLTGILGERVQQADARAVLEMVQQSVSAMEKLFSSLLDISKLDAGIVTPNVAVVEVSSLLRQIANTFAPLAQEKGLRLRLRPCSAFVLSDRELLERIVGNLVANAIRYTTEGSVLLGCRRRGGALRVVVADTGKGSPAQHLEDIFSEFFQVPGTERSTGLGLGLSIVKRSADLLGHPIMVTSVPGRGSVFAIDVPLAANPATAGKPQTDALPGGLQGFLVAVVDDEPINRFATQALFEQWGCEVVAAESMRGLLEKMDGRLRTPDLIVSDLRLADGETGVDVIEAIRELAARPIPALILTGDSLAPEETARIESIDAFIFHKPLRPADLRAAAGELLL